MGMDLPPFVDIHCHLIPQIDDGAKSWQESLAMARMASNDGIGIVIVTPHQLGNFCHNQGGDIRKRTAELQQVLDEHHIPLRALPGGDVRIENDMVAAITRGEVMSLGDHRRHVLLELPHELYFPLEPVLKELESAGMRGILSHPERNAGLLARPELIPGLVEGGCLMQVTSGSLVGSFGPASQRMAETMLRDGMVHFLASDGHSPKSRRPLIGRGFRVAEKLIGTDAAVAICCENPHQVATGQSVTPGRCRVGKSVNSRSGWFGLVRTA